MAFKDWLEVFGKFATAISVALALITYISTNRDKKRKEQEEKANALRARLQQLLSEVRAITAMIGGGMSIFTEAAAIRDEILLRLPGDPTFDDLRNVIEDDQLLLNIAINAWYKNPVSARIGNSLESLSIESARLTGALQILGEATSLLESIANDAQSPMTFVTAMKFLRVDSLFEGADARTGISVVLNRLVVSLQSNLALYTVARYEKAIKELTSLIEQCCESFVALSDAALLTLPSMSVRSNRRSLTRTGGMREILRALHDTVPAAVVNSLETTLENLELLISKDHAMEEAHRITEK